MLFLPITLTASEYEYIDIEEHFGFSPDQKKPLVLTGPWDFFNQSLLTPDQARKKKADSRIVLPKEYLDFQGTASLRIRIGISSKSIEEQHYFGLKIPYAASASKVWIDGVLRSSSGQFSPFSPCYRPQEIFFQASGTEIEILIQLAEYHHRRLVINSILFGTADQIRGLTHRELIYDSLITGSLLLLALYHFMIFISYRHDRSNLYFSLIAFVTALRCSVTQERILVRLWPDIPGELMMKLGFLPSFLLVPLLIFYFWEAGRRRGSKIPIHAARVLFFLYIGIILIFPLPVYDWLFQYTLLPASFLAVYVLYLLMQKNYFYSKTGARLMLLGVISILIGAGNDFLREFGLIASRELLSIGILLFLLIQAFFLSWKIKRSSLESERLAQKELLLNEELEKRIQERTRELEQANRRLNTLSRIDGLTEIPNRRYFEESYRSEWKRCEREKGYLSLIMIDVDDFKAFNDNYGHPAGDECLKAIAAALGDSLRRGEDFVGRYGGEEFIVLLPGHKEESARQLAEKLRSSVEALQIPHDYSTISPWVTISLGIASRDPSSSMTQEQLLKAADQALYTAKRNGKNRMV